MWGVSSSSVVEFDPTKPPLSPRARCLSLLPHLARALFPSEDLWSILSLSLSPSLSLSLSLSRSLSLSLSSPCSVTQGQPDSGGMVLVAKALASPPSLFPSPLLPRALSPPVHQLHSVLQLHSERQLLQTPFPPM
jgi:hypothetical protein